MNGAAIVFIVIDHLGNHRHTLYSRTSLIRSYSDKIYYNLTIKSLF